MSKGSRYRSYNQKKWDEGWTRAFGGYEVCKCGHIKKIGCVCIKCYGGKNEVQNMQRQFR